MRKIFILIIIAILYAVYAPRHDFIGFFNQADISKKVLTINPDATIQIKGALYSQSYVDSLLKQRLKTAKNKEDVIKITRQFNKVLKGIAITEVIVAKINRLVISGTKNINIIIDSPGGAVYDSKFIIDALLLARKNDIKTVCIVDGMAGSMATVIFSNCSARYATVKSAIMWHSASSTISRPAVRLNVTTARAYLDSLSIINNELAAKIRRHMLPWYYIKHFKQETLIPAYELESNSVQFLHTIFKVIPRKKNRGN